MLDKEAAVKTEEEGGQQDPPKKKRGRPLGYRPSLNKKVRVKKVLYVEAL